MTNINEILNSKSFDDGFDTPSINTLKFGKIDDVIKGTYLGKKEFVNDKGNTQYIYDIDVEVGSFHNLKEIIENGIKRYIPLDEPTIICNENKNTGLWKLYGKKIIDRIMDMAVPGQQVLFRYISDWENPKTGYVSKTIETKLGKVKTDFGKEVEQCPFD